MKKIEIMGCGYIGLPTAVTFTLAGYTVCGFDINERVVEQLNAGHIHIVEPGMQEALQEALSTGRLHFTTKPEPADVFIICVQTPYRDTAEGKRVYVTLEEARVDLKPVDVVKKGVHVSFKVPDRVRPSDKLYRVVPAEELKNKQ